MHKPKRFGHSIGLMTRNGKYHYPAIDYDSHDFYQVKYETRELQKLFKLHDGFIYETNKGFHVVYFYDNKLSFSKVLQIILTSSADEKFKKMISKLKGCCIRVVGKYKKNDIKFLKTIPSEAYLNDEERMIGDSLRRFHDSFIGAKWVDEKYLISG